MDIAQLDAKAAYCKGTPIRETAQMLKPLSWYTMSNEQREFLNQNKWWAKGFVKPLEKVAKSPADYEHLKRSLDLRDRLLTFGGDEAVMPPIEEDWAKIKTRGQLWFGDKLRMMKGEVSRCHSNSAALWEANKDTCLLATGYALSADGMWRQHSWGILVRPRQNQVVETTERRIAYFGFVMTPEEAESFALENI